MKTTSIIFSFVLALLAIAGCRKSDNPRVPDLAKVPVPLLTLSEESDTKISGTEPEAFSATFTVDVYFKFGEKPKSMDLVVIKNGDKSDPRVVLADITTYPVEYSVTGQQLIDLFGEPIVLGDAFEFSTDVVTQGGIRYAAFPVGGSTYGAGIAAQPGSSTTLRFAAPCLFDPSKFTEGDYEIITDEWADYEAGDAVAVTKIDDNTYSFKYKASAAQPIVMKVNPADNTLTVDEVMYGDYDGLEVTARSVPGNDTGVDPCDVSFTVKLNHVYSGGDLGDYIIKFRKL